ncbi:hypothetical protein Fmac_032743 [Flemingia macrophylla]|uniref:Translation elongation factor EF1B beta/delta subunit guanine nucleotide exchange domain-containing protein n=1 Tax=Flemingia macrophylla TaxID=520843 RepID=A0ABD1L5U0_9FABA
MNSWGDGRRGTGQEPEAVAVVVPMEVTLKVVVAMGVSGCGGFRSGYGGNAQCRGGYGDGKAELLKLDVHITSDAATIRKNKVGFRSKPRPYIIDRTISVLCGLYPINWHGRYVLQKPNLSSCGYHQPVYLWVDEGATITDSLGNPLQDSQGRTYKYANFFSSRPTYGPEYYYLPQPSPPASIHLLTRTPFFGLRLRPQPPPIVLEEQFLHPPSIYYLTKHFLTLTISDPHPHPQPDTTSLSPRTRQLILPLHTPPTIPSSPPRKRKSPARAILTPLPSPPTFPTVQFIELFTKFSPIPLPQYWNPTAHDLAMYGHLSLCHNTSLQLYIPPSLYTPVHTQFLIIPDKIHPRLPPIDKNKMKDTKLPVQSLPKPTRFELRHFSGVNCDIPQNPATAACGILKAYDHEQKDREIVAYASRQLKSHEQNDLIHNLELAVVVFIEYVFCSQLYPDFLSKRRRINQLDPIVEPVGKSSVLLDVKPWDDEIDMKKLEEAVRSVEMEGLYFPLFRNPVWKAMDDKIKLKQEQEEFKAELKSMCEAALWRRSQGEFPNVEDWRFLVKFVQVLSCISMRISMEGDEELLAQTETANPRGRKMGSARRKMMSNQINPKLHQIDDILQDKKKNLERTLKKILEKAKRHSCCLNSSIQEDEITILHVGRQSTHCWTVEAIDFEETIKKIKVKVKGVNNLPRELRIIVEFDDQGQAIGEAQALLAGFLGTLAADCKLFPMDYDRWSGPSGVPKAYFDDCFETILKDLCKRNKEIRSKQVIPHTGGSKANPRRRNELLLQTGKIPSRGQLYIDTHKRKDGSFVNDAAKTIAEQIQVGLTQSTVDESEVSPLDVVGRVLGP